MIHLPWNDANWRGVHPRSSKKFTSAPRLISSETFSSEPNEEIGYCFIMLLVIQFELSFLSYLHFLWPHEAIPISHD